LASLLAEERQMKERSRRSPGPTGQAALRRTGEANVFRVEPAGIAGWVVYLVGDPKTYGFLNRELAAAYAQKLARENRPSVVVVIEADGTVVQGWEFPAEQQTLA
jgi:hypothetical protein